MYLLTSTCRTCISAIWEELDECFRHTKFLHCFNETKKVVNVWVDTTITNLENKNTCSQKYFFKKREIKMRLFHFFYLLNKPHLIFNNKFIITNPRKWNRPFDFFALSAAAARVVFVDNLRFSTAMFILTIS